MEPVVALNRKESSLLFHFSLLPLIPFIIFAPIVFLTHLGHFYTNRWLMAGGHLALKNTEKAILMQVRSNTVNSCFNVTNKTPSHHKPLG